MSAVSVFAEQKQISTHLFRALLRQCTYLPDVVARREIKRQVVTRFRAHGFIEHRDGPSGTGQYLLERAEQIKRRLKIGRQGLRTLEKANEGGLLSFALVLRHAYGRTGKRRHELVQGLLAPSEKRQESDPGSSSSSLESAYTWDITTVAIPNIFMAIKTEKKGAVEYHIRPEFEHLKAILASQTKFTSSLSSRARIKEHIPSTPMKNAWGHSMPRKRIKNMAIDHYSYLIDRVLPPLPLEEWIRLDEIVKGIRSPDAVPPRRRTARPQQPVHLKQEDLEMLMHLSMHRTAEQAMAKPNAQGFSTTQPPVLQTSGASRPGRFASPEVWSQITAKADQGDIFKEELLLGPRFAVRRNRHNDPHVLTPRFVRRQLAAVFRECPRLVWDSQRSRWKVEWGTRQSLQTKVHRTAMQIQPLLHKLNRQSRT